MKEKVERYVTMFEPGITEINPYDFILVDEALDRIKRGESREQVELIRACLDNERRQNLKNTLLWHVVFAGIFRTRTDAGLEMHSGFIILDFDKIYGEKLVTLKFELTSNPSVYAVWLSPSDNGLKALVLVEFPDKHTEHYDALKHDYPELDDSGRNVSRTCYESYDPDIYINVNAVPYTKLVVPPVITPKSKEQITDIETETSKTIKNILVWLTNTGKVFEDGQRHTFVKQFIQACHRYGMDRKDVLAYCDKEYVTPTFPLKECKKIADWSYDGHPEWFGIASFDVEQKLVDKETGIESEFITEDIKLKDVIYGEDVFEQALYLFENGYDKIEGIGVPCLDEIFKLKRGEITLLTGIGNYGKSTFWSWFLLMRVIKFGEKFALYSPESSPAYEFYHDLTEILLGCDATGSNPARPTKATYIDAFNFVKAHIFFVEPHEAEPTPAYVQKVFLKLIIQEKVSGVLIDPFNQLLNDYGARSDKYLETFLSSCSRFAKQNDIFFAVIAHPKTLKKGPDDNYPCPDVYDIADGGMWNNKMDNILVYHRPNHQTDPEDALCELHSKKIRRQKTVGKKGFIELEYKRQLRRFKFRASPTDEKFSFDPMLALLEEKTIGFGVTKQEEEAHKEKTERKLINVLKKMDIGKK